ncbi:D-lactate dehydrogenase [Rhizobium rhizogenes]|uniref:Quinone-dependent D-lactate dehydrogenase n=1 Tax=Rhizobium rhizogenes NBRC 13257 TaxID=1220581 RepID=A0AA87U7B5_RHIRH|nr:D-lactate dehydrogenase [Rhizobium rhizogenes]NTF59250.1 D-lactate dehydrogenase [Rhizobium rhizogenes]NTF78834.1 D-lactate dehydrogenase [Rhizobium rhizogenes]NTF98440.1 D-lactate dehydrogenase [Rhizobium rhizogenes]NTG64573.1 D-lactate dehydrogenase [Rhizobium rhizogenes]NTG71156.1 D-lactate dehydrogenase [Rhizobium rhizogenes]
MSEFVTSKIPGTGPLPAADSVFLEELRGIVGTKHVLTTVSASRRYTSGYRYGQGKALAVVRPKSLMQMWRVLETCIRAGKIVIPQAANTGLTGGSTPFGNDYDRDVVVINTMRIKTLHLIDHGKQVVCLPGVTLDELEKALKPHGREPHSVIGSSCLGASVHGGIANNSGGSLIHRGPAYTELALFAKVDEQGALGLVNHLGIELGASPEEILRRLDRGEFGDVDISADDRAASDRDYAVHIRDIEASTPARFNGDPRRLYEASGSSGRILIFAVRLDTFEAEKNTRVFYIGTNDPEDLTDLRRTMLSSFRTLPIAAEYIHRDAYDIAERYGKDTFLLIKWLGTSRLPSLFAAKSRIDDLAGRLRFLPANLSDRLLQAVSHILPSHLPKTMGDYRNRFEHHLLIKAGGDCIGETRDYLQKRFCSAAHAAFFECDPTEASAAFLHRFAVAGAAVRYRIVHAREVSDIVALDIALPRNTTQWVETLPASIERDIRKKLYYGHFFCHVFHQDYIIGKNADWQQVEHQMLAILHQRGAKYPAEHNVGHLYKAERAVVSHYHELDPCNCFNPGIGSTSKLLRWRNMPVSSNTPHAIN